MSDDTMQMRTSEARVLLHQIWAHRNLYIQKHYDRGIEPSLVILNIDHRRRLLEYWNANNRGNTPSIAIDHSQGRIVSIFGLRPIFAIDFPEEETLIK